MAGEGPNGATLLLSQLSAGAVKPEALEALLQLSGMLNTNHRVPIKPKVIPPSWMELYALLASWVFFAEKT